MSSKRRDRFEKSKPKEEILLPPCTVKPLVVNGSRRVLPRTTAQRLTAQVLDNSNGSSQDTMGSLVADDSEQYSRSMPIPGAGEDLVPSRITPRFVDGSRRPLLSWITNHAGDDSRNRSRGITTPPVTAGSSKSLQKIDVPLVGPVSDTEEPKVVNGSRSPILRPVVPKGSPISSPSAITEGWSTAFIPQGVYTGSEVIPAWSYPSYFPSLPPNQPFIPQAQAPIYVYSPATYEPSQPSLPLWNPTLSGSHSSPITRSPTAHLPNRISNKYTTESVTNYSPQSSSSPYSSSAVKASSTTFSTPLDAAPIGNDPGQTNPQAPSNSVWHPAEDELLRSLVHISRNGTNDCDIQLSWTEIAERMNAYVEKHGPLGGENDQAEGRKDGGATPQRIYHSNKLSRRWWKIGGESVQEGELR